MSIVKGLLAVALASFLFFVLMAISLFVNRFELLRNVWELPAYTHQVASSESFMLPMRDGVKLHTTLHKPASDGPWPAVLIRNPYGDEFGPDVFNQVCLFFVKYGYACVYQQARGQMKSEGEWEPLVNEPHDTSDTLYWMDEENWMDGNMAMWGISYLALTQWAGAMDYPASLKTFMPVSMGTDFHQILYEKGNFRLFITLWVLLMPERGVNLKGVMNFWKAARHFPHNEVDEKFAGKKLDWYQEWIRDVGLNSPTWVRDDAIAVKDIASNLDIPVLIYEGWYDPFFSAELRDFQHLATREQSRMVIGPWSHIQMPASALPLKTGDANKLAMQDVLSWFDYYLRGNSQADVEPYIKTYVMGANTWKIRKSWPPATRKQLFAFSAFSHAQVCDGGKLRTLASDIVPSMDWYLGNENEIESISYEYNPNNPVMSRGGSSFLGPLNLKIAPGAMLQKGFCERDDVLTFISEPLLEDLEIVGKLLVKLRVSTDAEDTAFTAKVMDVLPDGRVVNIRDSISTLAYRNDARDPLLYIPNAIVDIRIDMWPIEWTVKAGHRLRVDISSSNFPAYNIHSNHAGLWSAQDKVKTARQTIYSGSYLAVPVELRVEQGE